MEFHGIEISQEEYKDLVKAISITKSQTAKIVPAVRGAETSSKIYVPKDWAGDRVIILNLGKTRSRRKKE